MEPFFIAACVTSRCDEHGPHVLALLSASTGAEALDLFRRHVDKLAIGSAIAGLRLEPIPARVLPREHPDLRSWCCIKGGFAYAPDDIINKLWHWRYRSDDRHPAKRRARAGRVRRPWQPSWMRKLPSVELEA